MVRREVLDVKITFDSNTININGTIYVRVPYADAGKHGIEEGKLFRVEMTPLVPAKSKESTNK